MIPMLWDLAAGVVVLSFLLILPTVASAHTQYRASGASQYCPRDTASSYALYGRYTWADIQGIRLMVRMP
jgi:hypothetical protein